MIHCYYVWILIKIYSYESELREDNVSEIYVCEMRNKSYTPRNAENFSREHKAR